ncbi:NAD(P)-dependent oxidoreductase [Piscinibacter sp. HJYY11]|uniref:NAD(P)-dependent oxidoreductase n=1 Tax=Piscinibacter sp. HJYY11 TaxID=2801333 RepID=UPI00191F8FBF|nr:NAD(P)-dependent oxidoreductase [Piscinibacter sp. HJYY11]MBL0727848.1 NAD(P)-dependent oxidoreductase [Piscinibacter sp. HJYY11]
MTPDSIGFIGLGVMGEPMCRNLARKSGRVVYAHDLDATVLQRLAAVGVQSTDSAAAVMERASIVLLSLPSGEIVHQLAHQPDGLLAHAYAGQIVVDLGTSPVDTTRALARAFADKGVAFIDAPVARTRAAAEAGTLSVMVGADAATFERVKPLIATFASDIALCGPVGCGQVVKILNNMVLFETVVALAEAKAIAERAGVDPTLLFETLSKGSADSFALRSHGMKAMLPGDFPERAFSVRYARKDLAYALKLAQETGVDAKGARTVDAWYQAAIDAGLGDQYHPVISQLIGPSP